MKYNPSVFKARHGGTMTSMRGVALIEALVALLVMSFGMVAVAGLLGTMRQSADLAKQRGEALRLAQQQMEQMRDYSVLALAGGVPAYAQERDFTADIPGTAVANSQDSNTTYQITTTSTPTLESPQKSIRVAVTWVDRAAGSQFLTMDTVISRIDPSLAGSLSVAPKYSAALHPPDGKTLLPPGAKDLGDGRSVLKPGTSSGTVAFVFNNISGVITSRCTVSTGTTTQDLTGSTLTSCSDTYGFALWGYVRFANASPLSAANLASSLAASYAQPLDSMTIAASTESEAQAAPAPPLCFGNAPVSVADGIALSQHSVDYFCVVTPTDTPIPMSTTNPTTGAVTSSTVNVKAWTGKLNVNSAAIDDGSWKVCRYSGNYDGDAVISNTEHPLVYSIVRGALGNQNFLVIKGTESCPTGATGTTGSAFFSTATVQHQPNGVNTPTTVH